MIFIDNQRDFPETTLLERAARIALEISTPLDPNPALDPSKADVTIVLTDDRQMHELNLDYLNVDAPTDVLAFPASVSDPETGSTYLGDVLISIPRAAEQAQAAGHSLEAEVQLLAVHGILHLLGYDHASAEEKARMWEEQAKVLEQLGLSHVKIQDAE